MKLWFIFILLIIGLFIFLQKGLKIGNYVTPVYSNAKYEKVTIKNGEIEIWNFDGYKESIILINGGPGVPHYMESMAEKLHSDGYNVILYNQRGTGNSISLNETITIEDHIEDLEGIRRHLNIPQFNIIGHSWGGLLAQLYNSAYPGSVNSLLLISSSTGIGEDWKSMEKNVMKFNKSKLSSLGWLQLGMYSGIGKLQGKLGDLASRKMMNIVMENYQKDFGLVEDTDANWLNGIHSKTILETRSSIVRSNKIIQNNIKTPVKLIYGEFDIYNDEYESIDNRFEQSSNIIIKDSGHLPWIQNSLIFYTELEDYYKEILNEK